MSRVKKIVPKILLALPVPIVIVIMWSQGVKYGWTLPFDIRLARVPSPSAVVKRIVDLAVGGYYDDPYSAMLWKHMYASLVRVFSGFGLATLVGVPLGVLMGRSKTAAAMLAPTINLIRPIPVTAWVPLTLIMIGIGDRSTIFLVFLAALFPIILNTVTAVEQVPERLLEAASMLGTSRSKALWKIVFPAALPGIIGGLRVAIGLAWALLVVGEMTGITVGLGAMITEAKEVSKTDLIVAGMFIIGILGFLSDRLIVWVVKLLAHGRPVLPNTK